MIMVLKVVKVKILRFVLYSNYDKGVKCVVEYRYDKGHVMPKLAPNIIRI